MDENEKRKEEEERKKDEEERDKNFDDRKPIVLKRLKYKYNYEYGTSDSVELHVALRHCGLIEIFGTEALSHLIKYKWEHVWYKILMEAIIYWSLLFVITFHTSFPEWSLVYYIMFGYCFYLLAFFAFYLFGGKLKMKDIEVWYYLDVIAALYMFYYLGKMEYYYYYEPNFHEKKNEFKDEFSTSLSMLNLCIWLRATSFLRVFKATRIFIFLLIKVMIALGSFFIFFFFFILTFSTSFLTINMRTEEKTFIDRIA